MFLLKVKGQSEFVRNLFLFFATEKVTLSEVKTQISRFYGEKIEPESIKLDVSRQSSKTHISLVSHPPTVKYSFQKEVKITGVYQKKKFTYSFPSKFTGNDIRIFLANCMFICDHALFRLDSTAEKEPSPINDLTVEYLSKQASPQFKVNWNDPNIVELEIVYFRGNQKTDCKFKAHWPANEKVDRVKRVLSELLELPPFCIQMFNHGNPMEDCEETLDHFNDLDLSFRAFLNRVWVQDVLEKIPNVKLLEDPKAALLRTFYETKHECKIGFEFQGKTVDEAENLIGLGTSQANPLIVVWSDRFNFFLPEEGDIILEVNQRETVAEVKSRLSEQIRLPIKELTIEVDENSTREVSLEPTDSIWVGHHKRINIVLEPESPLSIILNEKQVLVVRIYLFRTFGDLREKMLDDYPDCFADIDVAKIKQQILFYADGEKTDDSTIIESKSLAPIFCVIRSRRLTYSIQFPDESIAHFEVNQSATISGVRTEVKNRIGDSPFALVFKSQEYDENDDNVPLCSLLFEEPDQLFKVKSTLRECIFSVKASSLHQSFKFLLPKKVRVSELYDLIERKFEFNGKSFKIIFQKKILSDRKAVINLSLETDSNEFVVQTKVIGLHQRLELLEGNTFKSIDHLPLKATVDDLLQVLGGNEHIYFEQRGVRVFTHPKVKLGKYPLSDEAVILQVKQRPQIAALDPSAVTSDLTNVVTGSFFLPSHKEPEPWTFPLDAIVDDAWQVARRKFQADPNKTYGFTEFDEDVVLDQSTFLRDLSSPKTLVVVEIVDISVLPQDSPPSTKTNYRRLISSHTVADLKKEVILRFPDVELCSTDGEVLDTKLVLGLVARDYQLPLQLVPTKNVRLVRVELDGYPEESFLLDERTPGDKIRSILHRHFPGFALEEDLFDNEREVTPDRIVKNLAGKLRNNQDLNRSMYRTARNATGFLATMGRTGQFALDPVPKHTESFSQVGFVIDPKPSPAASAPSGVSLVLIGPPAVQGDTSTSLREDPLESQPSSAPGTKPGNYLSLLERLEEQTHAGRRACARCFNFHHYDFYRALKSLQELQA